MIKKHLQSIILILSILAVAIVSLIVINIFKEEGSFVEVVIDGNVTQKYSLKDDREEIIKISDERYNILVISNQKAYIKDASCPDHICVKHKSISFVGETITCLPNKVVIIITGESDLDIVI